MTAAEIRALVSDLCLDKNNATVSDVYVTQILTELSRLPSPPITGAELVEITSGTAEYDLPATATSILAAFYDTKALGAANTSDVKEYSSTWKDDTGTPLAYMMDDTTARTFRLYPIPDTDSGDFSFPTGTPLGTDYPDDAVLLIFGSNRDDKVPADIGAYVALSTLAREFSRPSGHQDRNFSEACKKLANVVGKLGGLA